MRKSNYTITVRIESTFIYFLFPNKIVHVISFMFKVDKI